MGGLWSYLHGSPPDQVVEEQSQPAPEQVRCPYSPEGKDHYTSQKKLMWHILKCPDYRQSGHLFSVCPYDALHVFRLAADLETHIRDCHAEEVDKIAKVAEYYKQKDEPNPWAEEWPEEAKESGNPSIEH